jgi:hypothetical protein
MILKCKNKLCLHRYQDAKYGSDMRVHNYAPKSIGGKPGYRCTVCKTVRGIADGN